MAILPGRRLGPYEIISAIGAGGMGEVYKARDTRLGRTVAIKILPQHFANRSDLRERFERGNRWRFTAILFFGSLVLSIVGLVSIHNRNHRNHATSPREQGTVKFFSVSKGYGFIQRRSGENVFFSLSQVEGHKSLKVGQTVEFEVVLEPKGLQAENITIPAPR